MATKKKGEGERSNDLVVWIPESPTSTMAGPLYAIKEGGRSDLGTVSTMNANDARHFETQVACEEWIAANPDPVWIAREHMFMGEEIVARSPVLPSDAPGATVVGPVGPPPDPPEPKVKLDDWVALSAAGARSSRFAGFAAHAKQQGIKSATDAEYRALFKDFLKAPVR